MLGCKVVSITTVSVLVSVKLNSAVLSFFRVMLTGKTVSAALTFINASVQLTSSSFSFIALGSSSLNGGGSVVLQLCCGSKRNNKVRKANMLFANCFFKKETQKK